jgi:predicted short-subunit dehydrogenase-like oxidoreductase (DUF2520 family)
VGIIGFGRVGAAFAAGLAACGHRIVGATARSEATRDRIDAIVPGTPILEPVDVLARADITFLTVPDDDVPRLAEALAPSARPGRIVAHACGVAGLHVLAPMVEAGAVGMVVHPVMTFGGSSLDVGRVHGAPFAVTAPALYLPIAAAIVAELGGVPFHIADADRPAYHAALCHAANHSQVLIDSARQILQAIGVAEPERLLRPVVTAAVDGALSRGLDALTGPASRGDIGTLAAHCRALDGLTTSVGVDGPGGLRDAAALYRTLASATVTAAHRAARIDATQCAAALDALRPAHADPGESAGPAQGAE